MKIFIDFDDVLFNTEKFKIEYFRIFKSFGIPEKIFDECYYDPLRNSGIKEYNPKNHIQRILEKTGSDFPLLEEKIIDFVSDTGAYIFPDVENFLKNFKKEDLFIVSFSLTRFQLSKIFNSGISDFFRKVEVVNDKKSRAVRFLIEEERLNMSESFYFLDDRVEHIGDVKRKFPFIKSILVRRPEGRYKEERNEYCDFQVENLDQVRVILKESETLILNSKSKKLCVG